MVQPFGTLLAVVLGWGATGCGGAQLPAERPWVESRSKHFVIKSDLGSDDVRNLTREFETSYAAIRSALGAGEASGTTHVVVMKNGSDFQQIAPARALAFFVPEGRVAELSKTIVMPLRDFEDSKETFQHELTHRFVCQHFPGAPPWLNEGLAEYLATVTVDGSNVIIGRPRKKYSYDGFRWIFAGRAPIAEIAPQVESFASMPYAEFKGESYQGYLGAWALVHVLMLDEPILRPGMDRYLRSMASGDVLATHAFAQSFGPGQMATVSRAYDEFLNRRGEMLTTTSTFSIEPSFTIEVRELTLAEKHVLWGRLRPAGPEGYVRSMRDAERAIKSDEFNVDGHLLKAELQAMADPSTQSGKNLRASLSLPTSGFAQAEADLRMALTRDPNNARVLGSLLRILLRNKAPAAELDQLAEALRKRAASAFDFEVLALRELIRKDNESALTLARKSLERDPVCQRCLETMARAAFRTRKFELAVRSQRFAINVAGDYASADMENRLASYEKGLATEGKGAKGAP